MNNLELVVHTWQTTPVLLNVPRKSSIGSPGV